MKFKDYMTKVEHDQRVDEAIVLGKNTWLFLEHPLFEDVYYPVDGALTEDEIDHFKLFSWLNESAGKKWLNEVAGKGKERKAQSWMGAGSDAADEYKAARDINPEPDQAKWDKEVKASVQDLNKKSRKAFLQLDSLAKKSFIGKYILHGLEATRGKQDWGRLQRGPEASKEIYSDTLKSYKEKQRFAAAVIAMQKALEQEQKEGEVKLTGIMKKFESLPDMEIKLGQSKDSYIQKLFTWAKDKFGKGWFGEDAYLEYMFKIQAHQYNNIAELKKCVDQWNAIGGNMKTKKSVDMTTICPKREKLLEMMKEWASANNDLTSAIGDGAEEATIAKLRAREEKLKVTDANNPTCAYCYVESGREALAKNPKYTYAKAERKGMRYQDTFKKWMSLDKDGNPKKDKDGNVILNKTGSQNRELFNKMGGLRFFASGDYIENEATDKEIEKIIADAEKVGLQLKAITKQEKFVKKYGRRIFFSGPLKGKPVFNINMSVDEQLGFPLKTAISLKKQYPGNVNIRVVARNPKEAIAYSKEKEVDVITLLHFKGTPSRMKNKELYQDMSGKLYGDMSGNSKGWKEAMEGMKKAHPKENWNKVFSKLCCTTGKCTTCPNACGFNPRRVADYTQLAKGGKKPLPLKKAA